MKITIKWIEDRKLFDDVEFLEWLDDNKMDLTFGIESELLINKLIEAKEYFYATLVLCYLLTNEKIFELAIYAAKLSSEQANNKRSIAASARCKKAIVEAGKGEKSKDYIINAFFVALTALHCTSMYASYSKSKLTESQIKVKIISHGLDIQS